MDSSDKEVIKIGQYIIVQRQKYRKIHKFSSDKSVVTLGKDQIELSELIDKQFYSTFKMVPKSLKKNRLFILEYIPSTILSLKTDVEFKSSGTDNRNIIDDGKSQKLTTEEITSLRGNKSSTGILETLITNSNTFSSKTEYSQEKYVRKKEKKYFEYIQILKPTIRILIEIMYRQNPDSVMSMRIDTLSQILNYSNVQSTGNFLLYETGTSGMLPAAILNAMGFGTHATLIHLHPGTQYQEKGLLMMNYMKEQRDKCKSVNVYSFLRYFYQTHKKCKDDDDNKTKIDFDLTERKRAIDNESCEDVPSKILKIEVNDEVSNNIQDISEEFLLKQAKSKELKDEICRLLDNKVDCLVIAIKEHPLNIFKTLLPFVHHGRPFVIYSSFKEPLQDTCYALSLRKDITDLHLYNNWMRGYQILPERCHPDIQMSVNSGYILTGYIVQDG